MTSVKSKHFFTDKKGIITNTQLQGMQINMFKKVEIYIQKQQKFLLNQCI